MVLALKQSACFPANKEGRGRVKEHCVTEGVELPYLAE